MAAEDVRHGDLLALLDAVKAEGKLRTANVLLTDLKQMFRFALTRDIVHRNPLDTVTKREVGGTPVDRERTLSADEVRMLAKALPDSGLQERFVCGVWLILSTGVRVGELLGAAWTDARQDTVSLRVTAAASGVKLGFVDIELRTWHLPENKNQRDHTIHLSDFALAQFRELASRRESEPCAPHRPLPWVFPNLAATGPVGVKSLGKQLSDRQREPARRLRGRTKSTSALVLPGGRWTAHVCHVDGRSWCQRRCDRRMPEPHHREPRAAHLHPQSACCRASTGVRCTRRASRFAGNNARHPALTPHRQIAT